MLIAVAWDAQRVIGLAAVVVTVPLLGFAILTCRRPSPVRNRLDIARLVVSAAAIALMASITQVSTGGGSIALAVGAGLLVGVAQGWMSEPEIVDGRVLVRKSAAGIAAWGLGVVAMQVAGILARTGTLQLGQAIAMFGVGLLAGTMLGRQSRLGQSSRDGALRTVSSLFIVLGFATAFTGFGLGFAHAGQGRPSADIVCDLAPNGAIFTFSRYFGGNTNQDGPTPACIVHYGPVSDDGFDTAAYQFTVIWFQEPFDTDAAAEARRMAAEFDSFGGVTDAPFGDYGYSVSRQTPHTSHSVVFGRGPFLVTGGGGEDIGATMGRLQQLAAGFDENIVAYLENTTTAVVPGETSTTVTTAATSSPTLGPGESSSPSGTVSSGDEFTPDLGATSLPGEGDFGDPTPPVSSNAAIGSALGGLLAAAAIGLISAADAGLLSASLVGRGPLSPGRAIAIINELLSGNAGAGSTPPDVTSTAGPPPDQGGTPPPPASSRVRTIQVTGADAEAILSGGPGSTVPIPPDQQWDTNVSMPGEPVVTEGRVGSVGVVRSVGPVVRGTDGSVSVSVEVDAHDPAVPPPPPTPAEALPSPDVPPLVPPSDVAPDVPPPPLDEGPVLSRGETLTPEQLEGLSGQDLDSPPPPPLDEGPVGGQGEAFTPEEVDNALDRGLDDLEDLDVDFGNLDATGTRPGDPAGDDGVWKDWDPNQDGRPDTIETDIDGDGSVEWVADVDGDGRADTVFLDTDQDGVPDVGRHLSDSPTDQRNPASATGEDPDSFPPLESAPPDEPPDAHPRGRGDKSEPRVEDIGLDEGRSADETDTGIGTHG